MAYSASSHHQNLEDLGLEHALDMKRPSALHGKELRLVHKLTARTLTANCPPHCRMWDWLQCRRLATLQMLVLQIGHILHLRV
mmetsp:Transcript_148610/g.270129  ORF Transcript_148610/g.270129 Transcript_148610/m.270129 type:complete len:83 (+) Transcript_148610:525-773(+)